MKKSVLQPPDTRSVNCSRLSVRLSVGQLCTLLGAIDICLHERARCFDSADLRALVDLHRVFVRKNHGGSPDYLIRDGRIVDARQPDQVIARLHRRRSPRLTLALSNG